MPYASLAQERFFHSPGAKRAGISASTVKEFDNATRGLKLPKRAKKKKKVKSVRVNNKMKSYGTEEGGHIEINVKKHKGSVRELANTIIHEKMHARHPKMKERDVEKMANHMEDAMSYEQKRKLAAKLRMKKLNYKAGAIKRKYKMKRSEKIEPGSFIKASRSTLSPVKKVAIMGLV